jgi:nucleoside 2-deoxyribosyltransferase
MKLFFAGAIRGVGGYGKVYRRIIDLLKAHGEILSEHIYHNGTSDAGGEKGDGDIYFRDTEWIGQADLLIAEISRPSIGVGYEIGYAEAHDIPVLALYHRGAEHRISAMVAGNRKITTLRYDTLEELEKTLKKTIPRYAARPPRAASNS